MTPAKTKEIATRARLGPRLRRSPSLTTIYAAPRVPGMKLRLGGRIGNGHPTGDSGHD